MDCSAACFRGFAGADNRPVTIGGHAVSVRTHAGAIALATARMLSILREEGGVSEDRLARGAEKD